MDAVKKPVIVLKEALDRKDYDEINRLQSLCIETEPVAYKLELDYKLSRSEAISRSLKHINEFMYYDADELIGYAGICDFGGEAVEVNGMVHPEYRRLGVFSKLFSLVRDEWNKRHAQKLLMLSDHTSASGLGFIKSIGAAYDFSEYEMYLRGEPEGGRGLNSVVLRKADNSDAKEVVRQNSIYFGKEEEGRAIMPEEEEKNGMIIYMAEVDGDIVGKVHLDISGRVKGIYGLGVLPEYRGKGFGRGVLLRAIEKLRELGAEEIMLQVAVENENALGLYSSCGFEINCTMDYYKLCRD
jgi:ribosomal protein S18 acetylase RimI-like enzyme